MGIQDILIIVLVAVGAFVLISAFTGGGSKEPKKNLLEERLRQFALDPAHINIDEVELAVPFADRILKPFFGKLTGMVNRHSKKGQLRQIQIQLAAAGYPWGMKAEGFLLFKIGAVFGGALLGVFMSLTVLSGMMQTLAPFAGVGLGYYFPTMVIKDKMKKRAKILEMGLPGALDILIISMDAGLTFESAMSKLIEKTKGPLTSEFEGVMNDLRLGRPRGEALLAMAEKNNVEQLTKFVQQIVQSEQLGVGLSGIMRLQSEELRRVRRQRAEEAGARAPLKMLLPMVGCIFPTIFLVLLGPAVVQVVQNMSNK